MKMLMFASMLVNMNFLLTKHPMLMIIMIISQTFMIALIINFSMPASWFSYVIFLIMLGGMMVLFIYIASLMSNENFSFNTSTVMKSMILVTIMITMSFIMFFDQMTNVFQNLNFKFYLTKLFSSPIIMSSMFTMLYLLITLIIVAQIVKMYEGPLRKLF